MKKELKIKPLTQQQIIISLDRLTRFKYTEDKYLRVFKEIIASNLIQPKYKKKELDLLDYSELTRLAEEIINFSLSVIASRQACSGKLVESAKQSFPHAHIGKIASKCKQDGAPQRLMSRNDEVACVFCDNEVGLPSHQHQVINQKLLEYEKSVFNFDKNVEKLLNNKIDYDMAMELWGGGIAIPPYCDDLPLNLKWLKSLTQDGNQVQNREKFGLKFPIEKVILVEGITEEILLPKFAKLCGCDFDKKGIHLISAGGKNQVVKLFYQFADILKLPIFVLLDSDAKENFEEIKPKLRAHDKVYILKNGEFEDILPLNLIKRTLNRMLKNFSSVSIDDLRKLIRNGEPMTKILYEILKAKGLEFKKAEFAALVCENISDEKDISPEIQEIISQLRRCEPLD